MKHLEFNRLISFQVLKYSIVFFKPFSKSIFGDQLSSFFAFDISGCLTLGSSKGNGLCIIFDLLFVSLIMIFANSFKAISCGLPILIGWLCFETSSLYIPSIKSET